MGCERERLGRGVGEKLGVSCLHLRDVAFCELDAGIRWVDVHVAVALADAAVAGCFPVWLV